MSRITYMRSWKSHRLTSHTWLRLNPQIGRPLSRISVPLVYFLFLYEFTVRKKAQWQVDHVKIVPIVLSTTGVIINNLHVDIKDLDLDKQLHAKLQKSVIINATSIEYCWGLSESQRITLKKIVLLGRNDP
jgi:hypothetical protein